jgi:2,3-bisphosphoglycerate-independent phosphoglycerate mutase
MEKVILVIRDGWGYRKERDENALYEVPTPNTDWLMDSYPNVLLDASGEAVGLPEGYQGNSEVGHMTIGSGRIIFQSLAKINKYIKDKRFFSIPEFLTAIENCKEHNSRLHLIGLLQTEGVHAHQDHLFALLDLCKQQDFHNVYIHVITDGRDAPIKDSEKHMKALLDKFKEIGFGQIVTISGRYYAMDRDKRWERTKQAYDCIIHADCKETFSDPMEQLKTSHEKNETDEFIIPKRVDWYSGIWERDSMIFYNFRTDRTRQFTQAVVEEKFDGWEREKLKIVYVAMTQYYTPMDCLVAFKDDQLKNLLGDVISDAGLRQLRISETEKYAHVTFFFNGQIEQEKPNEDRIMIPSPKVATYDLKPEMSVYEVADNLSREIATEKYDFIVTNLVNGDMVGHTGITEAIHKAVTAVDTALGKIVKAGLEHNYTLIVFADHGNVEDQRPEWRTSHTLNPVPCIIISNNPELKKCKLKNGRGLQDIAPTVLELMHIPQPPEMTGESIIRR